MHWCSEWRLLTCKTSCLHYISFSQVFDNIFSQYYIDTLSAYKSQSSCYIDPTLIRPYFHQLFPYRHTISTNRACTARLLILKRLARWSNEWTTLTAGRQTTAQSGQDIDLKAATGSAHRGCSDEVMLRKHQAATRSPHCAGGEH